MVLYATAPFPLLLPCLHHPWNHFERNNIACLVDANTWNGWINIGNVYKYLDLYTLQSIFKIIPIKYDCLLFTFACLTVIGSRLIASEQIQLASYQDLSLKRKSGSYKINKHFQTVTANFCDNERNNRRLIRNVDPTNSRFTDHSPISHRSNVYARLSADLRQCSSKNFATVNSLATVRDFPHVLTDFMRLTRLHKLWFNMGTNSL